jgi:hypothetical protein
MGALGTAADQRAAPVTEHEITLAGLEPGRRYYYAVSDAPR